MKNDRKHMKRKMRGFMGMGLFAMLGTSFIVMTLWNWLMPGLIGASTIGFFQALGLLILSRILFGRGHKGKWGRGHCGHGTGEWRGHFKRKMKEKMDGMSPEEKRKFKEGFMGGKWNVNIWEVEEEETEEEKDEKGDGADSEEKK